MRLQELYEGKNDPSIFKAVFTVGGPGSGKSYITQQLGLPAMGLKNISSDIAFEYLMKKNELDIRMPPEEYERRTQVRYRAKELTDKRAEHYINGRLGLIVDGTGHNPDYLIEMKNKLESLGYQTFLIFAHVSLETAIRRNNKRKRSVPEEIVEEKWHRAQAAKTVFANAFSPNFIHANNEDGVLVTNLRSYTATISNFIHSPLTNTAMKWIENSTADAPEPVHHTVDDIYEAADETRKTVITKANLDALEHYADRLFRQVGIDVNFTRHFFDRVNDARNTEQITIGELIDLVNKEFRRWGKVVSKLPGSSQGVFNDISTDLNVPFVIHTSAHGDKLKLFAKTIMRKKNFRTPDRVYPVV